MKRCETGNQGDWLTRHKNLYSMCMESNCKMKQCFAAVYKKSLWKLFKTMHIYCMYKRVHFQNVNSKTLDLIDILTYSIVPNSAFATFNRLIWIYWLGLIPFSQHAGLSFARSLNQRGKIHFWLVMKHKWPPKTSKLWTPPISQLQVCWISLGDEKNLEPTPAVDLLTTAFD